MEGKASLFIMLMVFSLVECNFTTDTAIGRYDGRLRSNHTLEAIDNIPHVRYRRWPGNCFGSCEINRKGYTRNQRRRYIHLKNNNIRPDDFRTCAESYYNRTRNDLSRAPRIIQDKLKELSTEDERAELLATHKYTVHSGGVNSIVQNILENRPLTHELHSQHDPRRLRELLSQDVDDIFCQSVLIQSYLQKKSLEHPKTVYRFEKGFMERLYEDRVYTTLRFLSTTEKSRRFSDAGINLNDPKAYPIELTINLKRSGADIADISNYPEQKEWLVPVGTKFTVTKENIVTESHSIIKVTLTDI